jgi:hypothetical protein
LLIFILLLGGCDEIFEEPNEDGQEEWSAYVGMGFILTMSMYRGEQKVHLRKYYERDQKLKPTTHGATFPPVLLDNLANAIRKLRAKLANDK